MDQWPDALLELMRSTGNAAAAVIWEGLNPAAAAAAATGLESMSENEDGDAEGGEAESEAQEAAAASGLRGKPGPKSSRAEREVRCAHATRDMSPSSE